MKCFDENSQIYQELLSAANAEGSGISALKLKVFVRNYYDKYERFPHRDEIPGIDSYETLKNLLELKEDSNIVSSENLKKVTGKETLEELAAFLNNKYSDKEISISSISTDKNRIHIDRRASIYDEVPTLNFDWQASLVQDGVVDENDNLEKTSSVGILNNIIYRLFNRHGINIVEYTNDSIPKEAPSNAASANAFILNGKIYINTDNAKADAPLHELMHLIIGQLRTRNPEQYLRLLLSIESLENYNSIYEDLIQQDVYKNRTQLDIDEEILVTEFSKFITDPFYVGIFRNNSLDQTAILSVFADVLYAVDTILLPILSSQTLNPTEVLNSDIISLSKKLGSALILTQYMGSIDLGTAIQSRRLSNFKLKLMSDKNLIQSCE